MCLNVSWLVLLVLWIVFCWCCFGFLLLLLLCIGMVSVFVFVIDCCYMLVVVVDCFVVFVVGYVCFGWVEFMCIVGCMCGVFFFCGDCMLFVLVY